MTSLWLKFGCNICLQDKAEKEKEQEKEEEVEKEGNEVEDMAMPIDKKRVLPAWMVKAANQESPTKEKASPKKPTSVAVNKRSPGMVFLVVVSFIFEIYHYIVLESLHIYDYIFPSALLSAMLYIVFFHYVRLV